MAPKYSVSDSESDAEADAPTVPSDAALEQALRNEVAAIFKSGNMEELTVKRVRLAAEKKLGVEEGFFKTTDDWKTRSDQIIKDEVVRSPAIGTGLTDAELRILYLGNTGQRAARYGNINCQNLTVSSATAQEDCSTQANKESNDAEAQKEAEDTDASV